MDSRICCNSMKITTGALVLGIFDLLWDVALMILAFIVMFVYGLSGSAIPIFIVSAFSIIFASCLLYGLKSGRLVLLRAFFVWKIVFIGLTGIFLLSIFLTGNFHAIFFQHAIVWVILVAMVALLALKIWTVIVVEKCRRYLIGQAYYSSNVPVRIVYPTPFIVLTDQPPANSANFHSEATPPSYEEALKI